ncbi:MAG: hypothetical protein ACPGPF_06430, partial [Pontibacterium sp.]
MARKICVMAMESEFVTGLAPTLSLSVSGLSTSEVESFASILFLADAQLDAAWDLVTHGQADVVLVKDSSEIASVSQPTICYQQEGELPEALPRHTWALTVDERLMPSRRALIEVLNQASHALSLINSAAPAMDEKATEDNQQKADIPKTLDAGVTTESVQQTTEDVDASKPSNTASSSTPSPSVVPTSEESVLPEAVSEQVIELTKATILDHIKQEHLQAERWQLDPAASVLVDYSSGRFFTAYRNDELAKHLMGGDNIAVHLLNDEALAQGIQVPALTAKPLSHLKWIVALCSPTEDYEKTLGDTQLRLSKWPDLTLLVNRKCIRLATLMQTQK